jgi:hypothetical protein
VNTSHLSFNFFLVQTVVHAHRVCKGIIASRAVRMTSRNLCCSLQQVVSVLAGRDWAGSGLVTARSEGTYVQHLELRETDLTVLARTVQNHLADLRFGRRDAPCLREKILCQVGLAGVSSTQAEGIQIKRCFNDGSPVLRKAQHDQVTGIPPGLGNK